LNNPGTHEGNLEEIELVKRINKGEFREFIQKNISVNDKYIALRLTSHKLSKFTNKYVKPKSDICFIQFDKEIYEKVIASENYIDEEILKDFFFKYISESGISVKMRNSKRYQIHKFTINSFNQLFSDSFLGAGAMIYSKNHSDFFKNLIIIEKHWGIPEHEFFEYFKKNITNLLDKSLSDKYSLIQKFSLSKLKETVLNDENIYQHIFTGKNDFEEPFCATFSFINNKMEKFKYTDFSFTTGSNRMISPTIVVKPK